MQLSDFQPFAPAVERRGINTQQGGQLFSAHAQEEFGLVLVQAEDLLAGTGELEQGSEVPEVTGVGFQGGRDEFTDAGEMAQGFQGVRLREPPGGERGFRAEVVQGGSGETGPGAAKDDVAGGIEPGDAFPVTGFLVTAEHAFGQEPEVARRLAGFQQAFVPPEFDGLQFGLKQVQQGRVHRGVARNNIEGFSHSTRFRLPLKKGWKLAP